LEPLFQSKSARRSYWLLLVGLISLLLISLFVYDLYLTRIFSQPKVGAVIHDFNRAVKISQALDPDKLNANKRWLHGRGFDIKIANTPDVDAQTVYIFTEKNLADLILKNYPNFKFNVPLPGGQWLLVDSYSHHQPFWQAGFALTACLLLICLVLLCYTTIRYTAAPLSTLAAAASRFARDVQAPPLAAQGSAEVQELITAFNNMQSQLRQLINDRTQMLAAISHDLRTPITRLQLRAEYLKGSEQYEKAVNDLNEMEQMISSILAFARDHAASEKMERFDLNALIESICDEHVDTQRPVSLTPHQGRIACFGRVKGLKRAINNLIGNALKYGQSAAISINLGDNIATIKIQDQGAGIPDDKLEQVFEPFYRVDEARSPQQTGSGLGLAVTRDIIRSHGGEIKLTNLANNSGLLATITLPLS
jgi:signal transduction histidine kinase